MAELRSAANSASPQPGIETPGHLENNLVNRKTAYLQEEQEGADRKTRITETIETKHKEKSAKLPNLLGWETSVH